MRIFKRTSVAASITAAVLCLWPVTDRSAEDVRTPPVSLPGTEVREIASSFIDQEFKLHISLPAGYADSTKVFPVVYLTDSDAYFGYFRSLAGNLHYGNLIPEIVVVGVAYEEDVGSYMRKRERDLLPAEVPNHPGSGQAALFLKFMREELLPFVEAQYRVDPEDRTIVGMSAGATFASYVLCTSPELFDRYIIVSPYLIYGQEVVIQMEKDYAREHDFLPARVYAAMGELEPAYARGPWNTLMENIKKRNYSDLVLTQETLEGLSHMDVVFSAYVKGLKEVFSDRSKTLRAVPANYEGCTGLYELGSERIRFTVRLENNSLHISRSGEYWDELIPVTDTRFGVEGQADVQFSFVADRKGAVMRMIIHQLGMEVPAEKID
jgi:predicted alpha/beta superfamily hydrolase